MKITQLAGSSCWASRMNVKTNVFKRIEINSPEDVSKLTLNDNFFVAGDDVADDIGNALKAYVDEIGASLILQPTKNTRITRYWIAPPLTSK